MCQKSTWVGHDALDLSLTTARDENRIFTNKNPQREWRRRPFTGHYNGQFDADIITSATFIFPDLKTLKECRALGGLEEIRIEFEMDINNLWRF